MSMNRVMRIPRAGPMPESGGPDTPMYYTAGRVIHSLASRVGLWLRLGLILKGNPQGSVVDVPLCPHRFNRLCEAALGW